MDGWRWNAFDFLLVGLMIVDQLSVLLQALTLPINLSVMRVSRLLRILRISRILRVFHLFSELNTMVNSMVRSMSSLLCAMMLLVIMIYIFAVFFMQIIIDHVDIVEEADVSQWFGSLPRTLLTLFECIVGGIGWHHVVTPLISDVSPMMAVLFCIYISASLFAMTNLVTGVFVTNVTNIVQEDKKENMATMIRDLFLDGTDQITWETFCAKLETPEMQEYLKTIDVDPSEARGLFDLLDEDGGGTIDGDEIVHGFLKLHGPAKALELSLLSRKINDLHQDWMDHAIGHHVSALSSQPGRSIAA